MQFKLGEALQFDWSEDWAVIAGEWVKLQVAHFKLSYSRAFFVHAYLLQTHEMLFDAHHHACMVWGGIPQRDIYDNMKTAVDKVKCVVNARFAAMVSNCLFDAGFCNPASGWKKGQIEKSVHTRLFNRKQYDWRNCLSVLRRKPGAIRNGASFAELPKALQSLQTILLKRVGGDSEMVDIYPSAKPVEPCCFT